MATVHTQPLTALTAQRKAGSDAFQASHPYPWLVWEIEEFKPASPFAKQTLTMPALSGVAIPAQTAAAMASPPTPAHGVLRVPLCFGLCDRSPFKVGRAPDCDVRINDATVSRENLWLEPQGEGGWLARPGASGSVTLVNGQLLPPAGRVLVARDVVTVGLVRLTFESPETMLARLDEQSSASR